MNRTTHRTKAPITWLAEELPNQHQRDMSQHCRPDYTPKGIPPKSCWANRPVWRTPSDAPMPNGLAMNWTNGCVAPPQAAPSAGGTVRIAILTSRRDSGGDAP
ncbi:hypothetical protein [Xylella fastidiosa]|uniref:hypothetical protein n=1 Tax=Xylella fastidiosa TaxID=2371 RepID=UPI002416D644|nr:hypothetical protein [Xylella fastidiosa]MDG4872192.1 hypothetical protein [Xylella fastidiosa subsp. multiplex]